MQEGEETTEKSSGLGEACVDAVQGRLMSACRSTWLPLLPGVNINAFIENTPEKAHMDTADTCNKQDRCCMSGITE